MIELPNTTEGNTSSMVSEVTTLERLDHPNIIRLMDVVHEGAFLYLVLEYLDNDLQYLIAYSKGILTGQFIKTTLHQILKAVAHCHSNGIVHRDFKPANVLVDRASEIVKVADFGLAKSLELDNGIFTPHEGTQNYQAPELLVGSMEYSTAADVWSVGCMFGEMVTGQPLFSGTNSLVTLGQTFSLLLDRERSKPCPYGIMLTEYLKLLVNKEDLADEFPGLEQSGVDLISKMLSLNIDKRITAVEALKHEYFKDVPEHY